MKKKVKAKNKSKIPVEMLVSQASLASFIKTLKIESTQEEYLLDNLPNMNTQERLDLLDMLARVYLLEQDKKASLERIKEQIV